MRMQCRFYSVLVFLVEMPAIGAGHLAVGHSLAAHTCSFVSIFVLAAAATASLKYVKWPAEGNALETRAN